MGPWAWLDMASWNICHMERIIICFLENQKDGLWRSSSGFSYGCSVKTKPLFYDTMVSMLYVVCVVFLSPVILRRLRFTYNSEK